MIEKVKSPTAKKSKSQGIFPQESKAFNPSKQPKKKVIMIAGPTACGKTSLSLMLAEAIGGEIISADSMQVYKGMDIGTAKVSKEDQERIPHHLIDIRHVQESINVVDYYYEATQCCDAILARNRIPIIVGGSGFYFRTLLYGPPQGPPSLPQLRQALEAEMKEKGSANLFQKLQQIDPTYAATITQNDKQKIIRALEIVTLTGGQVSSLDWKRKGPSAQEQFHCWFLYRPRDILYARIDERCEKMIESGLLDEVKALEKQGLRLNSSASQAIGYRQALDYLDSPQTEKDYEDFVRAFKTASRQYAKRQFTWFRKEPLFRWLNIEVHDLEIAMDLIINDYQST